MIPEVGQFALMLALGLAIVQATLPLLGAWRGIPEWIAVARPAARAQSLFVLLSLLCLTYAFLTNDFSVAYVAENSNTALPWFYRIGAVWGAHEGSLLLWASILSVWTLVVTFRSRSLPPDFTARVLGVMGWVSVGFILFMLIASNPFTRLFPVPLNGRDLNPLLQNPGLVLHPPMLYMGYVGFVVPFAFAISALLDGRLDAAWARWSRPWTTAAWVFLTLGIAIGSWWSYSVLGWGGWWFWDPVENSSFMPWLAGTALLHSAIVVEKRDTMKAWTIFLAILTFSLSLLGTFLVRSGILTSVHAFATDPERGLFILLLLLIVIGSSLTLFAIRAPALKSTGVFKPISREGGLLLNNLVMSTGAAVVLLGSLYPLFLDAIGGGKVSVGPPFFNSVFLPLMVPMIVAMGVGSMLSWKRSDLAPVAKRMRLAFIFSIVVAAASWSYDSDGSMFAIIGIGLAVWLGLGTLIELAERIRLFKIPLNKSFSRLLHQPRASWGMTFAHLGLAMAIAGMAGAGGWKVESIQVMKPGETIQVAGYDFTFKGAVEAQGPNYTIVQGDFNVSKDGQTVVDLQPEKRYYPVRQTPTTEAAIYTMISGDIYVVIGDAQGDDGSFVTRIYFNPLIAWMWAGALTMIFGSVVSVSDRRYRVGAPSRQSKKPETATA